MGNCKKILINDNCIKNYTIIFSQNGSAVNKKAAYELQKYIKMASGAELEVCGDGCRETEYEIIVGKTTRTDNIDRSGLNEEGFIICVIGNKLVITGMENKRGTLYGVYEFLEKYIGWRFAAAGSEILTCCCDVNIKNVNIKFIPALEYRELDWVCTIDNDWSVKNRVNAVRAPNRALNGEFGGGVVWGGGFVHTFGNLTGVKEPNQPCLSDAENLNKAVAYVKKLLADNPNCDIISVSQNDNMNYCKCEKCAAVDEEEGSHMGTLLRFVNAVADAVKADHPNVAIETLAYQYTRMPPKITRPRDNMIIRLCSIECCFSHSLDDPNCAINAAFKNDIEGWNKICDRLYIWDYVTDFSHFIPTFPNFGVLRKNMRFFAEHSVKGMYPEGNYRAVSGEFGELRAYMLAKVMWEPYMSDEEYNSYIDDFMLAYYGEGGKYIRKFLDFTEEHSEANHFLIWSKWYEIIDRGIYEANYDLIDGWWNAAEAEADNERILANIKRSRYQWTFIKLCLKPDAVEAEKYFNEVNANDIAWNEWHKRPLPIPDFNTTVPIQWY